MAHGPSSFRQDPALAKYNEYMKNRYKYFKWTPRIGGLVAIYMVLIPGSMAYLFAKTDGKYDFRGKLRGDVVKEW